MSTTNTINIVDGGFSSSTDYIDVYDNGVSSTEESFFTQEINGRSSENRIKERLSSIVKEQFPEFIQNDYSLFISFVEAYYRYLEKDYEALEIIQNARSLADINQTADGFIKYFLDFYALNFPDKTIVDKRLLLKKITQIYESKGSTISFEILFRILFNEESTVNYPYNNILRASSGTWAQNVSLRIRFTSGNPEILINRILTYVYNNVEYKTPIISYRLLENNLIELFIDGNQTAPLYNVGDRVNVYNDINEVLFTGTIDPTTVTVSILRGGSGFKVGQVFTIFQPTTNAQQSLVKVKRVNEAGSIISLEIISFGYNFVGSFFSTYLSSFNSASFNVNNFNSTTLGFKESFQIARVDPLGAGRYFLEDYTSSDDYTFSTVLLNSTEDEYNVVDVIKEIPESFALVQLRTGALAKYPGGYVTNEGFISESEVRIEDDLLYQPFAYQVESTVDISKFYDIVIQLLHPAGQRLFSSRVVSNFIDISRSVEFIPVSNVSLEATDPIVVSDPYRSLLNKPVPEPSTVFETDDDTFVFTKSLITDVDEMLSLTSKRLDKNLSDEPTIEDRPAKTIQINVEDSTVSLDSFPSLNIKLFENDVIPLLRDRGNVALDDGTFFFFSDGELFNLFEFESITIVEDQTNSIQKLINNDEDDPQIVDFGSFTLNDFVEGHYFEDDYVGIQVQIN